MSPLAQLSRWSSRHHGVVTTERLASFGLGPRQIRRLCHDGLLRRVRRGVYVVVAAAADDLQAVALACAATGGAASGTTAGRLWQLRRLPADTTVHVTLPYGRASRPEHLAGVRVHRTRCLPATDLVRRGDGITLTAPPRTLFDLSASVAPADLESMIEQGLDRGMFSMPTLWEVARRLAHDGRAGSTTFVTVLAARPAWTRPVGSHLELDLERALVVAGLPRPERQWPVRLPGGDVVHPDLAWPSVRLAIEVDHVTWHGGRAASTYDKWRDRQLRLVGWEVDRVTDADIRRRRATTVREVVALYRRRVSAL